MQRLTSFRCLAVSPAHRQHVTSNDVIPGPGSRTRELFDPQGLCRHFPQLRMKSRRCPIDADLAAALDWPARPSPPVATQVGRVTSNWNHFISGSSHSPQTSQSHGAAHAGRSAGARERIRPFATPQTRNHQFRKNMPAPTRAHTPMTAEQIAEGWAAATLMRAPSLSVETAPATTHDRIANVRTHEPAKVAVVKILPRPKRSL